jgi:hypothetical protein
MYNSQYCFLWKFDIFFSRCNTDVTLMPSFFVHTSSFSSVATHEHISQLNTNYQIQTKELLCLNFFLQAQLNTPEGDRQRRRSSERRPDFRFRGGYLRVLLSLSWLGD